MKYFPLSVMSCYIVCDLKNIFIVNSLHQKQLTIWGADVPINISFVSRVTDHISKWNETFPNFCLHLWSYPVEFTTATTVTQLAYLISCSQQANHANISSIGWFKEQVLRKCFQLTPFQNENRIKSELKYAFS